MFTYVMELAERHLTSCCCLLHHGPKLCPVFSKAGHYRNQDNPDMIEQRKLTFYFDYLSNNAYIAWVEIQKVCEKYHLKLVPKPVLFPALLSSNNQLGPAEVKPKREWMVANVIRKAALLGIPLYPPASHPFNPLLALRTSIVASQYDAEALIIDRLFSATWAESKDVSNINVIKEIVSNVGLDANALLVSANSKKTKVILRSNTEQAIEKGVFGVPTMIIDEHLFWGYDDFPYLELYLQNKDPCNLAVLNPWKQIRPSAKR